MIFWTTVIGQRIDEAENTRSMLICAEMARRGHEVVMWTSAFDHIRKEWRKEYINCNDYYVHPKFGFKIRFFKGCGYKKNISIRRFIDHWLGAQDFIRQAKYLPKPDVILSSVPDHITAAVASDFGKKYRVPVVIDIRDKWPDIFGGMQKSKVLGAFLNVILFFERLRIRNGLRKAFAIVAMMDSFLDWGLENANRKITLRDKVFYLTPFEKNVSDKKYIESELTENVQRLFKKLEGKIVFSFIGTFNRSQHPSILLEAIELLENRNLRKLDKVEFVIGGFGLDAEFVENECKKYSNVTYLGWLNTQNMLAVLSKSHVGLILFKFPLAVLNNKCFAYMASGLAVINGASGAIRDLITEYEFGINISSNNPAELADAIVKLSNDSELLSLMKHNSLKLFEKSFDRTINYSNYASHIEFIVSEFVKQKE